MAASIVSVKPAKLSSAREISPEDVLEIGQDTIDLVRLAFAQELIDLFNHVQRFVQDTRRAFGQRLDGGAAGLQFGHIRRGH